jgi:hypothetical protein
MHSLLNMKYYYYLKTATQDLVYQDEEVTLPKTVKDAKEAKEIAKVEPTKQELVAELTAHTVPRFDDKTAQTIEVKGDEAVQLVRWDGESPWVELIVGTGAVNIPFLGWPQVKKEDYVAPVPEVMQEFVEPE